jgi:hypothetical protein
MEYRVWAMETKLLKQAVELFHQQKKSQQESKAAYLSGDEISEFPSESKAPNDSEVVDQLDSELAAAIAVSLGQDIAISEQLPPEVAVEDSAPIASSSWSCEACTFFNSMADTRCSMCFTPRTGAHADASGGVPAEEGAGWWCPVCTLINPLHASM